MKKLKPPPLNGNTSGLSITGTKIDATSATSCGRALLRRDRVVVGDVLADADYAAAPEGGLFPGLRAQQSTPLMSRRCELLGMLTTNFLKPHRLLERELRVTDLHARIAAEAIECEKSHAALLESERKYHRLFDSMDE